jgi:hypothetical protein
MVSDCKKGRNWKNKAGVNTGERPDCGFGWMSIHTLRQGNSGGKGSGEQPEPASKRQILVYMRREPYEGKLSRMVLRREGAEQSALTQPTFAGLAS